MTVRRGTRNYTYYIILGAICLTTILYYHNRNPVPHFSKNPKKVEPIPEFQDEAAQLGFKSIEQPPIILKPKPKEEIKPDLLPSKDRLKLDLLSEKVEEQVIRVGHGVVGGGHGILEKDPTQILVNGVKVLPAAAKVPIVLPKLPPQGWSQRFKKLPSGGTGGVQPVAAIGILAHPLVSKIANYEFINQKKKNLTLCALIPGEGRFLQEWLVYHTLLGVDKFMLYDTEFSGAIGSSELDEGARRIAKQAAGEGAPTVDELKSGLGRNSKSGGLNEDGLVFAERIESLERFIESGLVTLHWMKFAKNTNGAKFHSLMTSHCSKISSPNTEFLIHADVDEFLTMVPSLFSPPSPYQETPTPSTISPFIYPLHNLLLQSSIYEAACIVLPEIQFRNVGIRRLEGGRSVLTTQVHRDQIAGHFPEKVLLHTAFGAAAVRFDGPHSCAIKSTPGEALGSTAEIRNTEIRNSQGVLLQKGGIWVSDRKLLLPVEPLAISHYSQRDLDDCHSKLSSLNDPNSLHEDESKGQLFCDEQYIPSGLELRDPSLLSNNAIRRLPKPGSVVLDSRTAESWYARATAAIIDLWSKNGILSTEKEIESARKKIVMLEF